MLEPRIRDSNILQKSCDFCDEFAGGLSNSFYARYQGHPDTRFVLSTENFHVFPSIGQLVDGYLLVAPKKHYTTYDEIPCVFWAEFERLHAFLKSTLFNLYGPCMTYEHGARSEGGCGIYHAHMHLVPFSGATDLLGELKKRFPWHVLPKMIDLCEQQEKPSSYLYCEAPDSTRYLFLTNSLPSQFMRRLLSEALGSDDWDWRVAGREQRLLATLEKLSGRFDTISDPARRP